MRKKVNVKINGERVRQYVYLEREDKRALKQIAKRENMSVSRLIQEWVKQCILEDEHGIQMTLDMSFKE